ncbi:MAG: glutamate--tRNA ligase [Pseudomonadota bacterium]
MSDRPVVTRIAPSPTGYMHIGTARTALFNWLYARGRGGRFLLRIEDTDKARSTDEATQAILDGMTWLGLDYDGEAVSQADRADRHVEVANAMLAAGSAYKCFSTQDEIAAFREMARAEGRSTLFRSPWRDANPETYPDAPYAIRVKAPLNGETVIRDAVQGDVTIKNDQLDDMIVLRSDGTPTYMLAVVVDDRDMGVTHVIRGDDHLNNAARQMLIYDAMGWKVPVWAHIPLIHGEDGKKLSKRHGALGIMDWAADGYPAAAMRNYLARLGWSHADDEFFSDAQALEWFDITGIKKSPARLDRKKLDNLSGQHIAAMSNADVMDGLKSYFAAAGLPNLPDPVSSRLAQALPVVRDRAKTFPELIDKAHFILTDRPVDLDEKAASQLDDVSRGILNELTLHLQNASWTRDALEGILPSFADAHGLKFGKLAGPLRAALAGRSVTPSVYDMMLVLGQDETVARLKDTKPE